MDFRNIKSLDHLMRYANSEVLEILDKLYYMLPARDDGSFRADMGHDDRSKEIQAAEQGIQELREHDRGIKILKQFEIENIFNRLYECTEYSDEAAWYNLMTKLNILLIGDEPPTIIKNFRNSKTIDALIKIL